MFKKVKTQVINADFIGPPPPQPKGYILLKSLIDDAIKYNLQDQMEVENTILDLVSKTAQLLKGSKENES